MTSVMLARPGTWIKSKVCQCSGPFLHQNYLTYRVKAKAIVSPGLIKSIDVNETDEFGYTGLHLASEHGHLKVVEELMVRQDWEENILTKCNVLSPSGWRSQAGPSCV